MKFFAHKLLFLSFIAMATLNGLAAQNAPMLFEKERPKSQIRMNNRVLAIVNQKAITLLDVMKQMDMVFYQQYPQYASASEIRCQFYLISWKSALEELVDKELILVDAEEVKMEVSGADLRQEVEEVFGPNVIVSLDEAGLTLDEAMGMVKKDIILRRMLYVRVQSKAIKDVTPSEIRMAYEQYRENYEYANDWHFQIVTIRDPDPKKLERIVTKLGEVLKTERVDIDDLNARIKQFSDVNIFTSVKISDEFQQDENDLSPKYKNILSQLTSGTYSKPQLQNKSEIATYKILYLNDVIYDEVPSFTAMSGKLKSELMGQVASRETVEYKKRLRKQFPVTLMDELISSNYQPFTLEANGKKIDVPMPPM